MLSPEPFDFRGNLADLPLTLANGKKIDTLRWKYQSFLRLGLAGVSWAFLARIAKAYTGMGESCASLGTIQIAKVPPTQRFL